MKLLAVAVLVAEFQQKLAQMALEVMLMILEPLQHPYEVIEKAEMKILQLVRTATIDLGLPEKEPVFLYGQNLMIQQLQESVGTHFDMASSILKLR